MRAVLLLGLALGVVGCVERTITITSEPSGALVRLNDEEVGRTPLTVPFLFYGVYDVRIEQPGYQTLWTQQKAQAPLWETPGLDLFAEAVPDNKVDLKWHFTLQPVAAVDEDALIDHAKQMRASLKEEASADSK